MELSFFGDIKVVVLVISTLLQACGMLVATGKFLQVLRGQGELLDKLSREMAELKEKYYFLEHREARELLHRHTASCRSVLK